MKLNLYCQYLINAIIFLNFVKTQTSDCDTISSILGYDTSYLCCNEIVSYCNSSGRVTTLNLNKNDLNVLSPDIAKLTELENLNLSNNQLTSLPSELFSLKKLKYLQLDHNQFKTISSSISDLSTLENLNLSYNELTSLPNEIYDLKNLKTLSISNNPNLSIKISKFPNSPIESCYVSNTNLICYEENACKSVIGDDTSKSCSENSTEATDNSTDNGGEGGNNEKKSKTWIYILIAVGVGALLIILSILGIVMKNKNSKKSGIIKNGIGHNSRRKESQTNDLDDNIISIDVTNIQSNGNNEGITLENANEANRDISEMGHHISDLPPPYSVAVQQQPQTQLQPESQQPQPQPQSQQPQTQQKPKPQQQQPQQQQQPSLSSPTDIKKNSDINNSNYHSTKSKF